MCLTIPGEIRSISGASSTTRTAAVDFDGLSRTVQLLYLPEARVGDFVMVHAGFAMRTVPPEEAREAWRLAREMRMGQPAAAAEGRP